MAKVQFSPNKVPQINVELYVLKIWIIIAFCFVVCDICAGGHQGLWLQFWWTSSKKGNGNMSVVVAGEEKDWIGYPSVHLVNLIDIPHAAQGKEYSSYCERMVIVYQRNYYSSASIPGTNIDSLN